MSVVLQAKFLRRAGHTVTLVSPALRTGPLDDPDFIDLPSWPIPTVAEYTWLWPRESHLSTIEKALEPKPSVDVVHVQSDFWGAALGYRFAARHGVPVVHTFHNRLDVGVDGTVPFPGLLYAVLGRWQRWSLGERFRGLGRTAYEYFAGYAREADSIVAPSRHFARLLTNREVRARGGGEPVVIPTGVDDDVIPTVTTPHRAAGAVARVVWVGRFSPEKRPVEFCEALELVESDVVGVLVGSGTLRADAERKAPPGTLFTGPLKYDDALREIALADVLVQSSCGFETQGMTVTEALALGTTVVVVDPDIASELPDASVTLATDRSAVALASAIDSAVRSVRSSNRPNPVSPESYKQSSRTAQAISLYTSLIAR